MQQIGIIGAGAWGTALAQAAANAGRDVVLWAREKEVAESITETQENSLFLPGVKLNKAIKATSDYAEVGKGAEAILLVTPAQHMRATLASLKPRISNRGVPLVICSKGIEMETGALMSDVVYDVAPDYPMAVLSGPTFASEVARGLPTAVAIASEDRDLAEMLVNTLGSKNFRPYRSDDPTGVQIGGSVKNVIAVACGVVEGMKLGDNAKAALITRGLAEMWRLSSAMGCKRRTLMGLSGMGDLTLTCNSMQSRNFSLGVKLGQGMKLNEILAGRNSVTEGVSTAAAVLDMAKNHAIDMPIARAVHETLNKDADLKDTVDDLLSRPFRAEL